MTKEIRLLLVNTVRTSQNGQSTFLLNYLRSMDRTGMRIGFAANRIDAWARDELTAMGVQVYEMSMRNRRPIRYIRALRKIIREGGYEIVHAHGNSGTLASEMLAAKLAGAPVRIAHSHNTRCNHAFVHRILSPLMQMCVTARFACGREAGEWLFGKRDFVIIRNASDAKRFAFDPVRRENIRAEMGLSGKTVIATVGSLNEQKNPLFLLEAFSRARKKNENLHLVMMGDGNLRQQAEAKIDELQLRDAVTLTGRINDVPDRLQAADMAVLPSIYEGFPCVLVEWQLNGLPSLVSEAVTRDCDMTGLLKYLPLDEAVWADGMAAAVPQEDRGETCAQSAQKVAAAGYEIAAEAARLKNIYEKLRKEAGK